MNTKRLKLMLCVTTTLTLAATAPALPAMAQTAGANQLEEVIVTAQRRSEKLQDVPITVTALNAESLAKAGVTNTLDLGKMSAGVLVPQFGAYTTPAIRGVSTSAPSSGDSTNVATYLDGVYQPFILPQLAELPDIQSIQILKGPQGSLYGQNAAGGAIVVDTVTPTSTLKGKATLSYGNYANESAQGYVTGPITDTLAFSIAGAIHNHDGFNRDVLRGGHDKGLESHQVRGKLRFQPTDGISLTLQGYTSTRNDSTPYSGQPYKNNSVGIGYRNLLFPNIPIPTGPHQFAMNVEPKVNIETKGVSLLGSFKVGGYGTVNTVTAYLKARSLFQLDVDASPVNAVDFTDYDVSKAFIQEANFVSNKFGRTTLTAGAFFMKVEGGYEPAPTFVYLIPGVPITAYPNHPAPPFTTGSVSKTKKDSFAVYGEVAFDITEQLTLTLGGRYANEKILGHNTPLPFGWTYASPLPVPAADPRGDFTFKKFTPRVVLRYKPAENTTFYASYSEGFKSGYIGTSNINACTPSPACINPPVRPESVKALEVGYKGRPMDWLNVGVSAFHYIYDDSQVLIYSPLGTSTYQNAERSEINGAEFEVEARLSSDFTAKLNAAYLDGKYKSFKNASVFVPTAFGGNTSVFADVSGKPLIRTPKVTANAALDYSHELELGEVGAHLGVSYTSRTALEPSGRISQAPYTLVDGELSFAPSGMKGLRVALWGKNLTNENYLQGSLSSTLVDYVSYAEPKTYGVRLEYSF